MSRYILVIVASFCVLPLLAGCDSEPYPESADRTGSGDSLQSPQQIPEDSPGDTKEPPSEQSMEDSAEQKVQKVLGNWIRADGGYEIRITAIKEKGQLEAGYFNPRPINVSRAEYSLREDKVHVVIEMRDANYPGSYYSLDHDPESDRLTGTYFQANAGQYYDVLFVRGMDGSESSAGG